MNALILNLRPHFTAVERCRIDSAALMAGTTPESIAEAAAVRALKRSTASRASYRLRMPDHARKKLEEHALALGCDPGELALFLLRRKRGETVELSG